MQKLTREEISKLVREYHSYHGDQGVHYRRVIRVPCRYHDEKGKLIVETLSEYYLVHIDNHDGVPYSVLDYICHDGDGQPYVKEMFSVPRVQEDEMIVWATFGGGTAERKAETARKEK